MIITWSGLLETHERKFQSQSHIKNTKPHCQWDRAGISVFLFSMEQMRQALSHLFFVNTSKHLSGKNPTASFYLSSPQISLVSPVFLEGAKNYKTRETGARRKQRIRRKAFCLKPFAPIFYLTLHFDLLISWNISMWLLTHKRMEKFWLCNQMDGCMNLWATYFDSNNIYGSAIIC